MLTCKEFDDFMVDYFEGTLSPWRQLTCWFHTVMCKECSRFVRDYKQTIALGQEACGLPNEAVPDTVPEEFVTAALEHRRAHVNQAASPGSETE